jgi:anti-sigma28 factor (negative regulator of flagellin synthesis)
MPTSKKSASKKASKKTSAKKSTKATAAAKQKIEFALDPERVAAIKRCLDKGTLRVTVSRADLLRGRVKDPWLYD